VAAQVVASRAVLSSTVLVSFDASVFRICYLFHSDLFHGLLFDPEVGGDLIIRNVGWHSAGYKKLLV
jgi:hypothetical protein